MNNSNAPKREKSSNVLEFAPMDSRPKVDKISTLWFALTLIFVVIFNALFFLIGGTAHNIAVWVSYGSIHFAYMMLVFAPRFVTKGKSAAVFGFTLVYLSMAYFVSALITGIVIIVIAPESHTAAVVIQLSMAGLYGILLISHAIANERTADVEGKRQHQIDYIKNATAQLKRILSNTKDRDIKRKIEKAYDAVSSSPVKSHPNMVQIETRILTLIDELTDAVSASEKQAVFQISEALLAAVNERSSRLKTYSH